MNAQVKQKVKFEVFSVNAPATKLNTLISNLKLVTGEQKINALNLIEKIERELFSRALKTLFATSHE